MVFDTSLSPGIKNGAETIIKSDHIQRKLMCLACRHHMMEILVSDVWNCGGSKSLANLLFKKLKNEWEIIHESIPVTHRRFD